MNMKKKKKKLFDKSSHQQHNSSRQPPLLCSLSSSSYSSFFFLFPLLSSSINQSPSIQKNLPPPTTPFSQFSSLEFPTPRKKKASISKNRAKMGNCLFAGESGEIQGKIKVITSNGGIMELGSPITVGCIADEFPGYGIFKSHDLFWNPLPHDEELLPGKSYYLLPRNRGGGGEEMGVLRAREGHVRSKSVPEAAAAMAAVAPYRMSFDCQGVLKRSQTEVFSRGGGGGGVWKVKLVISPKRLVEILEEEDHTEELIESVRTVAKCGSTSSTTSSSFSSSMAFSDHWSLSTATANATPSASSKNGGFLDV